LNGTDASTVTRAGGDFVLDSLPAGTQAITVRHLGYAPTEQTVELSSRTPARVTVQMGPYVPELTPVEVVSRMDQGLERVGWTQRKKGAAGGTFMGPDQIEARKAVQFTDLLTTTPGIRVNGTMGRMYIEQTRNAGRGGCVSIYVDGSRWQQIEAGDLDAFLRPQEVAAIEVYPSGTAMPVEFQTSGGATPCPPGQVIGPVIGYCHTPFQPPAPRPPPARRTSPPGTPRSSSPPSSRIRARRRSIHRTAATTRSPPGCGRPPRSPPGAPAGSAAPTR